LDDALVDRLRSLVAGHFQAQRAAFPADQVRAALDAYWERRVHVDGDDGEPLAPDDTLVRVVDAALCEWTRLKEPPLATGTSTVLAEALHRGLVRAYRAWFTHFDVGQYPEPPLTHRHRAWAESRTEELLDQIDETTRTRVLIVIRRAIGLRRSVDETVRDVLAFLADNHAGRRPALIAETEALDAYHRGVLDGHRELGATAKAWRTRRDGCVCAHCAANEARGFIPLHRTFPSGHQRPLAHPNCRCWLVYRGVSRKSVLIAASRLP